ncbi:voltage-gated potassium channel [Paenibacillus shirakamiensis]|uniref:Voltage-gated potassium channel n=1 Tax=Paenibacillus shirakamiensis TaxID=1265935 RepID=A0ABS4JLW8_9BACL|nr:ion channel [Paenibacillus shirakamiensis]MBP2002105.1 voltage-gated potassium channel [Paenibacillus shirakamiensis]
MGQTMIIWLDIIVLLLLGFVFYRVDNKITGRVILLAPILIYVALSLEDLFGWIDFPSVLTSKAILRGVILLFVLFSVIFYILFIFRNIAQSVNKEVQLKSTILRIFGAIITCIFFFTIVYTSIYKLFGQSSFKGSTIGDDLVNQGISFLYFSVVTFATVGFGDISPMDSTSRLVVVMEVFFSFVTIAYALSMIGVFRSIFKYETADAVEEKVEEAVEEIQEEVDEIEKI